MKVIKNNIKIIFAFIIGLVISVPVVYATGSILYQSSQISFDNTRANLTKENGEPVETLEEAVESLARNGVVIVPTSSPSQCQGQSSTTTCQNTPFKLGDYIDMTPTQTTFSTDTTYTNYRQVQTLHPNYLNVWRVLRINSDCTVELISEYVSETGITFKGKEGYQNFIYYLNEIAKQYANTTYTLNPASAPDGAFRNVGYYNQTKLITDTTRLNDNAVGGLDGAWYAKSTPTNNEESLGGGDQGYSRDYKLMEDAGISYITFEKKSSAPFDVSTATLGNYWLASRVFAWEGKTRWSYNGRVAGNYGVVGCSGLLSYSNGSSTITYNGYSVRPIVTLKSNVTHSSGSGTSDSHYTLSVS